MAIAHTKENEMQIPRVLRAQVREYEKAGFHVKECKPCNGAHFKLWFEEFADPQVITKNLTDWRSIKNNIANYKRKRMEQKT